MLHLFDRFISRKIWKFPRGDNKAQEKVFQTSVTSGYLSSEFYGIGKTSKHFCDAIRCNVALCDIDVTRLNKTTNLLHSERNIDFSTFFHIHHKYFYCQS